MGWTSSPEVLRPRAAGGILAGTVLSITDAHHHEVGGLEPLLVDAAPLAPGSAVPYYLATGSTLTRDVAAGTVITCADVDLDPASGLGALRAAQDERFFG